MVVAGRVDARIGAAAAALEVDARIPNGIGNSSNHVGHNFCEHVMGPGVTGLVKERVGKPKTIDDGRPGGFYVPRFRNLAGQAVRTFIRGYGFEGSAGSRMFPGERPFDAGLRRADTRRRCATYAGAFISMGGFGEVLARYENQVDARSRPEGQVGHSGRCASTTSSATTRRRCARTWRTRAQEMFEAAGFEIVNVDRQVLTEGWSIHELGTARMGTDPKTSVLNQFQQSHDVKNLFVVDGSSHVSASCQNPTWTIMALAWRSCDYLADEFGKGNL